MIDLESSRYITELLGIGIWPVPFSMLYSE